MNSVITFKSTSAGETLEARVTKRNGQTTTKSEPINRSKNNKNNNPSNKSPREIEGVPCIASTIPNTPNNPLLASSNLNNSNSNNIDQFIQRLRSKYNLVKEGQMPIDAAMGLMEGAEAKNCLEVWDDGLKNNLGEIDLRKAQRIIKDIEQLDFTKLKVNKNELASLGRSGELAQEFVGNPNTLYKSNGNHYIITDEFGNSILDINTKRIKVYYKFEKPDGTVIKRGVKYPDFKANKPDTWLKPSETILEQLNKQFYDLGK